MKLLFFLWEQYEVVKRKKIALILYGEEIINGSQHIAIYHHGRSTETETEVQYLLSF